MTYELSLTGKTAIVTGAARGLGASIATAFLMAGANVVLNSRTDSSAFKQTIEELGNVDSERISTSIGDVADSSFPTELATHAKEKFGSIDILVNNAGITRDKPFGIMKESEWDEVVSTNLKGAFLCSKAVNRQMAIQQSGRIINISSISAVTGREGQTNYSASKSGLIGFTKSLARELAPKNILVNAVVAGIIDTRMTKQIPRDIMNELKETIPLGRIGLPEEIAKVCLFLASDLSSYVTGTTINVSGGGYI